MATRRSAWDYTDHSEGLWSPVVQSGVKIAPSTIVTLGQDTVRAAAAEPGQQLSEREVVKANIAQYPDNAVGDRLCMLLEIVTVPLRINQDELLDRVVTSVSTRRHDPSTTS